MYTGHGLLKWGVTMELADRILEENPYHIKVTVDTSELDAAFEKAEKLLEMLKQAQELSAALPLNTTE